MAKSEPTQPWKTKVVYGSEQSHRSTSDPQNRITDAYLIKLTRIFKALSDVSRLKIILALSEKEMCVGDLAELVGLSESAISHQLRRLHDLDLVKKRREGQFFYYTLDNAHVSQLLRISLTDVDA